MLRRVLIAFGYSALTILLVGVTFALVAYGNDYAYDFSTHKIIQKGHVILDSLPGNLKVTVDGKELSKKTPFQAAFKVGTHTFALSKDGYWSWQKTLQVWAGQVTLARYVILLPKSMKINVMDTRKQIVAQSISKDHRHLAYVTGGDNSALYTLDLPSGKPVKLYTPKVAVVATPTTAGSSAEVLRDVAWSDDASHLLIMSQVGTQTVYRLAAASGGEPTDLTDQYKEDFSGLKFSGSNWRQMYWISPEGLRRLDVGSQAISAVLADKVTQFWITTDRVLYVQETDTGRSLWSLASGDKHQELIEALAQSDSYDVSFATYRGEDELAVVPAKTEVGTLYSDIFGNNPVAKIVAHGVTRASFSPDGHLLAFTSPTSITTYDLEQSLVRAQLVSYTVTDQPGNLEALNWFDNYHLLLTRSGRLYWSEFDGANRVDLGTGIAGLPSYGSSDTKSLTLFSPDGDNVRIEQAIVRP
ncbi:MAG TPA: PEGA domain-containing protein [Candidatus Saccharimonadia bacterium]|jgi:hypothetical protein